MEITILGHVCIDKNTSESASYTSAGSPAMFMNKIFKQLPDNSLTIIAPYGQDFGKYKGDARILPKTAIVERTLIYENISKLGKRQQKAHNWQDLKNVELDSEIISNIQKTDLVFVAPLAPDISAEYLKSAFANPNKTALKVLLPQGYYRTFDSNDNVLVRDFEEADQVLPLFDLVIVSEQDHPNMVELASEWAKKYKITMIVTLGEKGAVAVTENSQIMLPTRIVPENEIVDTVGSGDIFSAGFSYRYQQTHNLEEAGRFANELARQCLFFTPDEIKIDYSALIP